MEKNRVYVLSSPVDIFSFDEILSKVENAIETKTNFQIVTLNPEMIMNAKNNPSFLEILSNSDLNMPEGVGVKIALKMKKINNERIRGVDLARKLIELANNKNYKIALLGAKEEVILKTKENILKKYPNLDVVYTHNGYFEDENKIIDEIKISNPQILLVALGSPKQEQLIAKLKNILSGTVMIGVGGSFDVFSGSVKEAPIIYRKLGIEWLYRTILEPKRLKRIFPTLPIFLIKCIIDNVAKKG